MNRTRGFVNLNRFKSGKAIKRRKVVDAQKPRMRSKKESKLPIK